jgi:beta-lactamase regulating signal transducer with metallopeptidase domain
VAHIGLLALVIVAFLPLVLRWNVEAPALFAQTKPVEVTVPAASAVATTTPHFVPVKPVAVTPAPEQPTISVAAAASAVYAIPAAILLLITALALLRLFALRARADVLVDGHWLSALARAQRRMGFKHGTALLTSNELASPISWGLMRPVILLNNRAVEAAGEAEAILAHELAHVARMDWAKLLLARVACALFWFNPFVWMLAREAHQLREETADDAVLAADIADTDYAQLLVGVARHECPGLLLGAHGVAPSKTSLARRVARVLDGKSVRGPVAGGFAVGVFVGAVLIAAPLAALTFTPAQSKDAVKHPASTISASEPGSGYYPGTRSEPADLPHLIASGVSTSVATAAAAIVPSVAPPAPPAPPAPDFQAIGHDGSRVVSTNGVMVATSANGASAVIYPPDAHGRSKVIATSANGATATAYMDANQIPGMVNVNAKKKQKSAIDRAIEMKSVGVTPEYVSAIRAVAPQIRLSSDDLVELKSVGVTPEFIQELARAGYSNIRADDITEAYAVGIRPDYIRGMAAAGYPRIPLGDLVELKAVGVTPSDVQRFRRAGFTHLDVDDLVQAKTLGLTPEEIRASERDDP